MLYFFIVYCFLPVFSSLLFNLPPIYHLNPIILLTEVIEGLILVFILSADSCSLTWFLVLLCSPFELRYLLQHIHSLENPTKPGLKTFKRGFPFTIERGPWCVWGFSVPQSLLMGSVWLKICKEDFSFPKLLLRQTYSHAVSFVTGRTFSITLFYLHCSPLGSLVYAGFQFHLLPLKSQRPYFLL